MGTSNLWRVVAFKGVAMTVDAARRKLSKLEPNILEN